MQVEFDHHDCLFMQSWDLCALWTVLCSIRSLLPGAMASGPSGQLPSGQPWCVWTLSNSEIFARPSAAHHMYQRHIPRATGRLTRGGLETASNRGIDGVRRKCLNALMSSRLDFNVRTSGHARQLGDLDSSRQRTCRSGPGTSRGILGLGRV